MLEFFCVVVFCVVFVFVCVGFFWGGGGRGVVSAVRHSEIVCIIRLDRFLKDFCVKYVPYKERQIL